MHNNVEKKISYGVQTNDDDNVGSDEIPDGGKGAPPRWVKRAKIALK